VEVGPQNATCPTPGTEGQGHSARWLDGRGAVATAFVAVLLFGVFLRTYRLHTIPPGLFFDEAANLFDVESILHGAHPLYFPANNGREPLFFYWASLFARVWGVDAYALRLASAVVGSLTIAATFFCAREAFLTWGFPRKRAEWAAIAAAFVLSITYMHLHFSRFGLRTITLPLFLALAGGFLLRGPRGSWWSLFLAGVFGGIGTYTYISSRLAPALLIVPPIVAAGHPRFWRVARQMILVGVVWLAVSLPLGAYYLGHPEEVQGHTDDVSILNPTNNHGDALGAVLRGAALTLGSIDLVGSNGPEQNLPGRPILDPAMSLFFFAGSIVLVASAVRGSRHEGDKGSARRRLLVASLLIGWIVDQSIPSVLAVNPPGFVRMTGLLPALAIVVALGIVAAWDWLGRSRLSARSVGAIITIALIGSTFLTARDYFLDWGPSRLAYGAMMADKSDSGVYLASLATTDRVFLAPLYAQDNTIKFLTRGSRIDSFDLGKAFVLPTDRSRGVDYVFPASDPTEAATVAGELPVAARAATVTDPTGQYPLLTRLQVPALALPPPPATRVATFQDGIALTRVGVVPTPARVRQTLAITLEWLDLQPVPENYTVFLHLRDATNHTVAQVDRQPTDGSFPTTAWRAGDLVQDRYTIDLSPSVLPGRYRLVGGLYRLATLERLPARTTAGDAPGAEVELATVEVTGP